MSAVDVLVERLGGFVPTTAIVLGSGLGDLVESIKKPIRVAYRGLPGFPVGGVSGHSGEVVAGYLSDTPVLVLAGRAHYYEHGNAAVMRPVIEALAGVGITKLFLTNAAGSVDTDMPPGSLMMITDHINFSGSNPLFDEPTDQRFVSMTEAYDRKLRIALEQAAAASHTPLHQGIYMWFSGPSFETPAEIRVARMMGANAVGMSTVPEVILARFFGIRVAACSVITNFAAGITGAELSHDETREVAPRGGAKLGRLLQYLFASGNLDS